MNVDGIISKAREATGLTDIGDPTMLAGLEVLVKASNEEAQLSEAGVSRWEGNLVRQLSNRLRVVDYLKQHPELPAVALVSTIAYCFNQINGLRRRLS